jgi:hypothetical protein
MRLIRAKVIDGTHIELSQTIEARPGEEIELAILGDEDDEKAWREAGLARFLMFYEDQDSIYDEL